MEVVTTPTDMQAWADRIRSADQRIGFVPTMGYLHAGHLSLVDEARRRTDHCVVSIFVNPLQFGPSEDLARYPHDLPRDSSLLRTAGVSVLYTPSAAVMYPKGFQTDVSVNELTRGLCGEKRPGHFRGVTTVVAKLFHAVKPHVAVFGRKDFQQLVTIQRMVRDLDFDIEIVGAPIVREPDGLAMSSRNSHLSPAERRAALCLSRALAAAEEMARAGERRASLMLERVRSALDAEPLARIDYAEIVDAEALESVADVARPSLLALAVFIGNTRLIDNTLLNAA